MGLETNIYYDARGAHKEIYLRNYLAVENPTDRDLPAEINRIILITDGITQRLRKQLFRLLEQFVYGHGPFR